MESVEDVAMSHRYNSSSKKKKKKGTESDETGKILIVLMGERERRCPARA